MRSRTLWMVFIALYSLCCLAPLYAQPNRLPDFWAQQIFQATNQARARHGLPPLRWSSTLAAAANAHLSRMMREPDLSHDYPGEPPLPARAAQAGAHFVTVAENIAMGYSIPAIQQEWMHSPAHRANILDPRLNAAGVAVGRRRGNFYAVVDFAAAVRPRNASQAEEQVDRLLQQAGVTPDGPRTAAEAACAPGFRLRSGTHVRLLVRFTTPDLSHLPPQVAAEIHEGGYRHAAAALCPSDGSQPDFATYRVALLLY